MVPATMATAASTDVCAVQAERRVPAGKSLLGWAGHRQQVDSALIRGNPMAPMQPRQPVVGYGADPLAPAPAPPPLPLHRS